MSISFKKHSGTIVMILVLLHACDPAPQKIRNQVFDKLVVVSAVPMSKVSSGSSSHSYEPSCRSNGTSPDGLMFQVLLLGSSKGPDDHDVSIRPGSYIHRKAITEESITTDLFELELSCIEPLPDAEPYNCDNPNVQSVQIHDVDFFSYHKANVDDKGTVALAILLDMSGSMQGWVNSSPSYSEHNALTVSGTYLMENATDPNGVRFAGVEKLITSMNDKDPVIVFAFSEDSFDVVCSLAKPGASLEQNIGDCLGTNRDLVLGENALSAKSALDSLKGKEWGRTPLWYAVDFVYRAMDGDNLVWSDSAVPKALKSAAFKHIVVVGDGPDTCALSTDLNHCRGQCAAYHTPFEEVLGYIESKPVEERIPVHFVQMQAKGYPERDPRQQDVACLTGGQYTFINTPDIQDSKLQEAISQALVQIRYTFRGYWRFMVPLTVFKDNNATTPGIEYAVEGHVTLLPGKDPHILVSHEQEFAFESSSESELDQRVSVRKECDPDDIGLASDCGEEHNYNECSNMKSWCDEQTLTCQSGLFWESVSPCPPQDIYVSIETHQNVGGNPVIGNELFQIKNVETRCCMGSCMPPAPPEVPEDVAKPPGSALSCFRYDDDVGWLLTNPARFDRSIVECVDTADCSPLAGLQEFCIANVCERTCITNSDCDGMDGLVSCMGSTCIETCANKADCPGGWVCVSEMCLSVKCESDGDCDSGYFCKNEKCSYDFDDPDKFAWIHFASLDIKDECQIEDFEQYLSKYADTFEDEDWSYCNDYVNCFQPPEGNE
jgi:hypothetical protein